MPASRYVEFAILRGDPSDGLPGVKGVGEKTARDWSSRYPSIDAMLEAAAAGDLAIKPAIRERLLERATTSPTCSGWCPSTPTRRIEIWAGERDDEALTALGGATRSEVPCSASRPPSMPPGRDDPNESSARPVARDTAPEGPCHLGRRVDAAAAAPV